MLTPNGKASPRAVSDFEKAFQIQLPQDYQKFLKDSNGGNLQGAIIKNKRPGELLIDCLFGFTNKDETDLRFWQEELKGEIPHNSVVIGSDAGGGFLLLCLDHKMEGVYYYDHSYLYSTSSDTENTYLLHASFSAMLYELEVN